MIGQAPSGQDWLTRCPRGDPGLAALAADPDVSRWAGQVLTSRQLADEYGVTDVDGSRPDCWGHIERYGDEHQTGRGVEEFR